MKANHPVKAARWAQAIAKSIEWARRDGGGVCAVLVFAAGDGDGGEDVGDAVEAWQKAIRPT
jgi:hypothetical protein